MFRMTALFLLIVLCLCPLLGRAALLNAKDFGALGDGKADDTAALQAAIDAAGGKAGGGELVIPAGNYLVSKTLKFDRFRALIMRGEGCSAFIDPFRALVNPTLTTSLIWTGADGGTLIESSGCVGSVITGFNLIGRDSRSQTQEGRAGILFHVTRPPGYGDMINRLGNLALMNAKTGIQMGSAIADHNCSDYLIEFVTFATLDDGFKVVNDQGVDFLFNFIFAGSVKRVLNFEHGGNLLVNNAQMTNCDLFCNIGAGGRNTGTYTFNNIRVESSTGGKDDRRQLLRCVPSYRQAHVKFTGYDDCQWNWNANKTPQRDLPLCEIGPGAYVVFESSIFNSPVAALTGAKDAPANLVVRECSFGYVTPKSAIKADALSNFKILDCTTDKMVPYADLVQWNATATQ